MDTTNQTPAAEDAQALYDSQKDLYALIRSQYPDEAGLVLEYFQNDKFLSREEISDVIEKQKIHDGLLRTSLNEQVKARSGRSVMSGDEVKMVSAVMACLPQYFGLESTRKVSQTQKPF